MTSAIVYRRYPWENTWEDITSSLSVSNFDIEERVNGAGICTLSVGNARRWAERALFPGINLRVYLKTVSGQTFEKPDFEGYIPPDFQQTVIGIESQMDIPIVGYYDLFGRTQNRFKFLNNNNVVSVMHMMNEQVLRRHGSVDIEPYMTFAGQYTPPYLAKVSKYDTDCKQIVVNMRKEMMDDTDPIFPRFFHITCTPQGGLKKPLLALRREPSLEGTPFLTIPSKSILNIASDNTNTMLTSVIIGNDNWSSRYSNWNTMHKYFLVDKDIKDSANDGLDSSYQKTPEINRYRNIGRSITVRLAGLQQIPLLSRINFDSDENELQGNSIVYGRHVTRSGSIQTELLVRNLPDRSIT